MAATSRKRYGTAFYESQVDGSRASANALLPIVNDLVKPASVLDVGSGVGTWLAEWLSLGVTDVVGLDGDYVQRAALQIPPDKFVPTDLRKGFSLGRKFDLVQSLEVAEHLDGVYADEFVESLTSHGDVILFSAAIPFQSGEHHVNEQWPPYWIEKFARVGFKVFDVIRPVIWTDARIEPWYRQNIFIFSSGRSFDVPAGGYVNAPSGSYINVVHPDMWRSGMKYEDHPREVLQALPGALATLARRKLGGLSRR